MKLNRKQIKEALQQTPIEQILLGQTAKTKSLTAKQKAFAEKVAQGLPKAKAYREAYPNNMTPPQQGVEAHRLALNPKIQHMIEAQKVALEAMKYQTPAHLRALAIQRLTELAIDDNIKPAQQLKALELIGKMTEVALFTERKEIINVSNTAEAKAKLIESIKLALSSANIQEGELIEDDDSLERELKGEALADYVEVMHETGEQTEAEPIETTTETENETQKGDGIATSAEENPPYPNPLNSTVRA